MACRKKKKEEDKGKIKKYFYKNKGINRVEKENRGVFFFFHYFS